VPTRESRTVELAKPIPLSVSGLQPEAPSADTGAPDRAERVREVPIFVDLDREDLESGLVLKLRICFRRSSQDEREETVRFREVRAA
jgi:hypothetical protein